MNIIEQVASDLNGNRYRDEIGSGLEKQLRAAGIVVVFGGSDDLMEFRGAIHDEVGAHNEKLVYLSKKGLLRSECEKDDCPYFEREKKAAYKCRAFIKARWCPEPGLSWAYETAIPHATFIIKEDDGADYCRGIVFKLADVP